LKKLIILISALLTLACGTMALPAALPTAEKSIESSTFQLQKTTAELNRCYGMVTASKLNLRADADYTAPADGAGLVRDEIVYIVGTLGDWYKVRTDDGREGYAHSKYISRPGCK
jgi:hypothetical protein